VRANRRGDRRNGRPAPQGGELALDTAESPLEARQVAEHGVEARQTAVGGDRHAAASGDDQDFQPLGPFDQPERFGHPPAEQGFERIGRAVMVADRIREHGEPRGVLARQQAEPFGVQAERAAVAGGAPPSLRGTRATAARAVAAGGLGLGGGRAARHEGIH
jgi:hypothetical protein